MVDMRKIFVNSMLGHTVIKTNPEAANRYSTYRVRNSQAHRNKR